MTTAPAPGATETAADRRPAGPRTFPNPATLAEWDEAIDRLAQPFRGRRAPDLAALVVSNLADYGVIWVAVAAAKGLGGRDRRRRALRRLAVAGVTSASVNTAVKALVRRERPDADGRAGREPLPVRAPSSSSFPSGHTLAAFCTATVFAGSPAEAAAYLLFATAVAASRVHLGAHHGTDVLGGAAIGLAAGALARILVDRLEADGG